MIPICDLHCDLLSYLRENTSRSPFNEEALCSFPQLKKGKVIFQTLAVFTETEKGSSKLGAEQIAAFKRLPPSFVQLRSWKQLSFCHDDSKVCVAIAFENASSFAEEDEPIEIALKRLDSYINDIGVIVYISLTWNGENRFGGGNLTNVGLKNDGRLLLDFLDGKNIAVDLSHTSDALAHDIINYIDEKGLQIQLIASHSNLRIVKDHPRNLPETLAKEIIRRKGIIGINLFRFFVGDTFKANLMKIVDYAVKWGGEKQLCFGADFFYADDFATSLAYPRPFFDHEFGDASVYPKILSLLEDKVPKDIIEGIAYKNFADYVARR